MPARTHDLRIKENAFQKVTLIGRNTKQNAEKPNVQQEFAPTKRPRSKLEGTKLGISLEQLRRNISAAWDSTACPTEVVNELRRETSCDETREACANFIGKTWRDVSDDAILTNCPNPFLIGDVPFSYYLPAFMLVALRNPDDGFMSILIEFQLIPPRKKEKFARFENRFASLTEEQRLAVAQFLDFASANLYSHSATLDARFKRRVNHALNSYWGIPHI